MAVLAACITWKGPQFKTWIWWILCFISLPSISASCMGVELSVSIYPEGDLAIQHGNPLEIFCVAEHKYSSEDIQFINQAKQLDSEIVNSTTRRLYIEEPEKQASIYYCQNKKDNKICTSRVYVDSIPSDVNNFNCVSQNLERINCSWSIPNTFLLINYEVSYYLRGKLLNPVCVSEIIKSTRTSYCVWDTSSTPRYRQSEEELVFNLKACNRLGCNSQNFTIDHFAIVKPLPPHYLRELRHDAHSVLLRWKINNNLVDFMSCGVDHAIQYRIPKLDNGTHFRTVETSDLPKRNRSYILNLTDLPYAHTQYEVRIRVKSTKATKREFWSEYKYLTFTTSSEIPKRPPTIKAGTFEQIIHNENERVVNVYWQQIKDHEEAGPDFTYKVLVNQGDTARIIFANESMNHVSFKASHDAVDITVWSTNINGSSLNSSHIYIPPEKDTQNLRISCFTKLNYENGTYLLTWDGLSNIKNIDNYTLLWCKHKGDQICNGRISFAVLDSKTTTHFIDLTIQNRYQFGISANKGANSGGITWAKIYGTHTNRSDCITR